MAAGCDAVKFQKRTVEVLGRQDLILLHACSGMHDLNAGIARKAGRSESQNAGQAMCLHGGHQARIMRPLAGHVVMDDQGFPYWVDGRRLRQECEHALDARQLASAGGGRHAKAVLGERPGSHNPQLYEILSDDMQFPTLRQKALDTPVSQGIQRMLRLQGAEKNTGIDEHECAFRRSG